MNHNSLIGERVRFYRTSRGISMADLANQLSMPFNSQQMAKYETGLSRWRADMLMEVAELLKVDIRCLIGMEDMPVDSHEAWEAERYKCLILKLPAKLRKIVYRIIDGVGKIMEEKK